jgi:nicotinamide riboside transporter PnuC
MTPQTSTEPNAQLRSAVRGFYLWIASTLILGAAPLAASHLIDRGTTFARIAAVVVGVLGMLPWMWVVFSIIRRGDEFVRRMHLISFAFAFGGSLMLLVALEWLVRADLIYPPDLMFVLLGCLLLWFLSLMATKHYFERAR